MTFSRNSASLCTNTSDATKKDFVRLASYSDEAKQRPHAETPAK